MNYWMQETDWVAPDSKVIENFAEERRVRRGRFGIGFWTCKFPKASTSVIDENKDRVPMRIEVDHSLAVKKLLLTPGFSIIILRNTTVKAISQMHLLTRNRTALAKDQSLWMTFLSGWSLDVKKSSSSTWFDKSFQWCWSLVVESWIFVQEQNSPELQAYRNRMGGDGLWTYEIYQDNRYHVQASYCSLLRIAMHTSSKRSRLCKQPLILFSAKKRNIKTSNVDWNHIIIEHHFDSHGPWTPRELLEQQNILP